MGENLEVCGIDIPLIDTLKKFRFRKNTTNCAIILKIDMEQDLVTLEDEYDDISIDELRDELPESQPRFIVLSYKYQHNDGRVSYPLCLIYCSPGGCKPELNMKYAGSKNKLVGMSQISKVFDLRSTDEFTEDWLKEKLEFFH